MTGATFISVIITTYNRPNALEMVLRGLVDQKWQNFEVIVADDGSDKSTKECVDRLGDKLPFDIKYVWQPDQGFRAAMIRNKAAAIARGDYLVFLDGDCIPRTSFLRRHTRLAQPGWFVAGNRVLLSQDFTRIVLACNLAVQRWGNHEWLKVRRDKLCNRVLPFMTLPVPILRRALGKKWRGAITCNLGLWKEDFFTINGFNESYVGWGYEDSDLVIRLIRSGIRRKEGRFSIPVIHLWHPANDRSREHENNKHLELTQHTHEIRAKVGLEQYI